MAGCIAQLPEHLDSLCSFLTQGSLGWLLGTRVGHGPGTFIQPGPSVFPEPQPLALHSIIFPWREKNTVVMDKQGRYALRT